MHRRSTNAILLASLVTGAGCAGEQAEPAAEAADAEASSPAVEPTVRIVEPAEGSEIGAAVRVVLETMGIEIVPAAEGRMETGHHHLFLDTDLTPLDEMIPAGVSAIVHKGDGSAEHTFEGLEPGPHRLIALVADPAHVPIDPPIADTVNFVVSG